MGIKKDTRQNEATCMLPTHDYHATGTLNVSQPLDLLQIVFKSQMCRLLILHLVCFCWVPMSMSLKVFSFERTQEASDPSSSLSFASLDSETSEDLPSRFY